jgi:hypothetical protein
LFPGITQAAAAGAGTGVVDVWGADEIHGESGDDASWAGGGNDVVFADCLRCNLGQIDLFGFNIQAQSGVREIEPLASTPEVMRPNIVVRCQNDSSALRSREGMSSIPGADIEYRGSLQPNRIKYHCLFTGQRLKRFITRRHDTMSEIDGMKPSEIVYPAQEF